ncbi:MAG: hypothetical protein ACE5JQ_01080 [Candidatus Methylomirabilales bacterium]
MFDQSPRVVVVPVSRVWRPSVLPGPDTYWIYLGKDVERRRRVEALLGLARRYSLGARLHDVAARLRQPFLNFVSEVGTRQRDSIAWWSSAFSWKSWAVSDLFLLVCYLRLAQELVREAVEEGPRLLVVVEDPWLYRQMEESLGSVEGVRVRGRVSLGREKVRLAALGILKRAWWLVRMLRNYWRQRWVWGTGSIDVPARATAAIYSYPLERCLRDDGGWQDPFLPNVDDLLGSLGYEVRRFSPPEASGLEREIARRRQYFHPLILYATVSGVCRSLLAFWWPRWPGRLVIDETAVRFLAEREWWKEIGRSSLCIYRMFYECLREMSRRGDWEWIVYPYENQPWEKMIALCARELGIRTAGIQHAIFSAYSMSYSLGEGEAAQMPLPDVICASGLHPVRLLAEGGTPGERLRMCGSVRYGHLGDNRAGEPCLELGPARTSEILVALPIDFHMARHLLAAIREVFPSGGREEGLRFHVKTHPMCPIRENDIGFPALRAPGDFHRALEACGVVIFVGSTVGPEAMAMGRRVLRYRPELLLNVDPSEVYGDRIPTCTDSDLRAAVINQSLDPVPQDSSEGNQDCAQQIFAPLDRNVFAQIFGRPVGDHPQDVRHLFTATRP